LCRLPQSLYGSKGAPHGSLHFSASLVLTLVHCGAVPPLVVKTRGLNEDFSMSIITLWLYRKPQLIRI